jgi:hypothetical protein
MSTVNVEKLREMELGDLRAYAKQYYQINSVARTTADQLIADIVAREENTNIMRATRGDDSGPQKGWARIVIEPDRNSFGGSYPVFAAVNTYTVLIPRGVECDVPLKVYEMLRKLTRRVVVQDWTKGIDAPGHKRITEEPRHNVRLISKNEGDDPRGSWEKQRDRKLAPFRKFYEEFGFYPTAKQLKEHIQSGQFKMTA